MIEQYMTLALQPTMRGCRTRPDVMTNIRRMLERKMYTAPEEIPAD